MRDFFKLLDKEWHAIFFMKTGFRMIMITNLEWKVYILNCILN